MTNAEKFYKEHFVVDMNYELDEESMATVDAMQQYADQGTAALRERVKELEDGLREILSWNQGYSDGGVWGYNITGAKAKKLLTKK